MHMNIYTKELKNLFLMYANCLLVEHQKKNFCDLLKAVHKCESKFLHVLYMPLEFVDEFQDLLQCKSLKELELLKKDKAILPLDNIYDACSRQNLNGLSEAEFSRMLLSKTAEDHGRKSVVECQR